MFYPNLCACFTSYNVVVKHCILFKIRYVFILTFYMMGLQKGSKKGSQVNILETFFGVYLTYKLPKTVVSSQCASIYPLFREIDLKF